MLVKMSFLVEDHDERLSSRGKQKTPNAVGLYPRGN